MSDGVMTAILDFASPTPELFVTTYPQPLPKKLDPTYDLQLFDLRGS
jgi:hypothetical protein